MNFLEYIKKLFQGTKKIIVNTPEVLSVSEAHEITKYGHKINKRKLIQDLHTEIATKIRINSNEKRVYEAFIRKSDEMDQETFDQIIEDYKSKGYRIIKIKDFPHIVIMSWY
jgi:hypothetical protein